ncbi:hypothetical protein ARALYDRAFT_916140 [Arabidopsis lyrata subsp. lyrata]|uniref:Uncharacterized protein n=1 Tax=Arabidopsis lyrata subsp. lyrata TaxID=81972 RepID=D7MJ25_ARALL|nr:hypothetical protein ARALYDRAFT_916140 [Arabidopsis lyrata subsp. lyrata]
MEERSLREDKLDDDRTLRMRLRALCASSSVFCTEPQIQCAKQLGPLLNVFMRSSWRHSLDCGWYRGKSNPLFHCFYDGTWSTVQGSFTAVCDFKDVLVFSYSNI